jgi:hypothetical protein
VLSIRRLAPCRSFWKSRNEGRLRIGLRGDVGIATGERVRGLAIPVAAIVDGRGIPVAFVQVEGESFERRSWKLETKRWLRRSQIGPKSRRASRDQGRVPRAPCLAFQRASGPRSHSLANPLQ